MRGSPAVHAAGRGAAEIVRGYGLRNWVEQGYKQVKHELGWADVQVRSDTAIRRHYTLVCCAHQARARRSHYRRRLIAELGT